MRFLRLTAAGLLLTLVAVGAVARGAQQAEAAGVSAPVRHTCSATDRKFLRDAKVNMMAVGKSGREFMAGKGTAAAALEDVSLAAAVLEGTRPTDPSLDKARVLVSSMLREYGKAIRARSRDRDAGPSMYRAYGLANVAHDVLASAEPGLRAIGCDVSGLL